MYSKERLERIMKIVEEYNYVTVKYLVKTMNYSNATINRDLKTLENQGRIKRTYGGVELIKTKAIPMEFRYHKMKHEKRLIAKAAAKFIDDGDIIFIDDSTTTHFLKDFIFDKTNLTVITNNISLVMRLSECGIKVICLGGTLNEAPHGLYSELTIENVKSFRADKMFFSSTSFYANGNVGGGRLPFYKGMMENSKEIFYLADRDKFNKDAPMIVCTFDDIDYIVSDFDFSDEAKSKFNCNFVKAQTE